MGIPFYGRGWTNVPNVNNGLYQSSSTPAAGTYEAGFEDYKVLKWLAYPRFFDPAAEAMWIFDGRTFWSYDDEDMIARKTAYLRANGLAGAMVWSLDGDDGTLMSAIDRGLR